MLDIEAEETRQVMAALGNVPAGKRFIELLKRDVVMDNVRGTDPHDTYYRIGVRDFAALLVNLSEQSHD